MSSVDMTETTFQFVVKLFAVIISLIMLAVLITFCVVIWRDGNDPLVQNAFSDLVALGQWSLTILGGVIVGKPVASGIGTLLQANALSKSPQNMPAITPASLPTTTQAQPSAEANNAPLSH